MHLRGFYLLMMKIFQKNPANNMRATLACRFTCVCIAHVLEIPFSYEKRNPIKLNIAYKIVNLSKM